MHAVLVPVPEQEVWVCPLCMSLNQPCSQSPALNMEAFQRASMPAEEGQLERRVPLQGLCWAFLASLTRCSLGGRDNPRRICLRPIRTLSGSP